ncbi:GNAT family N-acetyltransferase [Nocardia zapadnayensis]|uniref:GNAT family N-acetyltransferase n=1 Tax=Nocardia rhamnosiphila TaxID=426716 RepID=UPI0022477650|nr:GNAT family N-acetyltransferase [Nocardia zapadnayensis]MCX0275129.1 GNAT family N-acetyltransferase [Nocardia zapadnayensis]
MTIEIVSARELGEDYRRPITEVFADAFGPDFSYFAKSTGQLTDTFEHMLVLDLFYVALVDGRPAGITACTDGRQQCVAPDGGQLRKHLGPVNGTIAHLVFRHEFLGTIPEAGARTASLEFVGTATQYKGQGVATALLQHLLALPQYREYLLDGISDINTRALALYERLGFVEYKRRKVRHTRRTGINHYISMKLIQD